MSLRRVLVSTISASAIAAISTIVVAPANAQSDPAQGANISDQYVLADTYTNGGKTYTAKDGLRQYSGELVLPRASDKSGSFAVALASANQSFGSSYAKSSERLQLWYDGSAFASGKKDFYTTKDFRTGYYRVMEVCFKYMRDGKDLISWQCSKATPGPLFGPGAVVKKTVRDTLNPVASKTVFKYSYKII